ncbi:MAG: UDP-N-acetylglucosamine 2-epimerase [Candidatus Lokiarchaeia archaeon]
MAKKQICIITGTRAEYSYLKIVIEKIIDSKKLDLSLIVTGMHLLKEYGHTIDLIKKDNIPIKKIIPMYDENDSSNSALGKAVGRSIINFTEVLSELKPDILLILGDRYEPLVAAITASTLKILIAHIHGGDVSGTIDESLRHAITKLSHIHFPASPKSAKRIELMGEEKWRINMVGSTTIDNILHEKLLSKQEICKEFELNESERIALCIQHPNIYESEKAGTQMNITLQVLRDLKLQVIIIYPNNDIGSELIIKEINKYEGFPRFKIYKNIQRRIYLSLIKNVDFLIGNSSSGLIESPIFKLPVINIGDRNKGRETAENVIDVIHDYDEIKNAIKKALSKEFRDLCKAVKNPYGDGKASERIVRILEDLKIEKKILIKKLTYKV